MCVCLSLYKIALQLLLLLLLIFGDRAKVKVKGAPKSLLDWSPSYEKGKFCQLNWLLLLLT